MTVQLEFLKSIPYFQGLSSTELESVRQHVFERTVPRGELIQLEGEKVDALFFVVSGAVKVFKTSAEGKEQILAIARPGDSFNDTALFDQQPSPASAETMTPAHLYGITRASFESILHRHPRVALNTARVLAEQTRRLVSLVEDLSFRHVTSRVARILLENAGNSTDHGPRLTQQDMAAMAGTVREVVARSLRALEEDGLIRMERQRIHITDRASLQALAGTPA